MNPSPKIILIISIIYNLQSLPLSISQNSPPYDGLKQPQPHQEDLMNTVTAPKPGWIDPFDMLGDSYSHDSLIVQSEVEIHTLKKRCDSYEIHLRRFVNLFLMAVDLKEGPAAPTNLVKLEFLIGENDIKTLKEFGQGPSAAKIEFVSDVFTKIFSQKTPQDRKILFLSDFIVWFQKSLLKVLSSPEWTILSSVVMLLLSTLWFVYRTHSYRMAIFTVLLTIFVAGFGFTWIRMYEEKEVERYVSIQRNGEIPKHCSSQSQSMAWYEHMYYRMFGVNCQEFFVNRDIRPIVKVSPTDVLAETFSSMIIKPASNIGKAYGSFVHGLVDELPWYLKPFAVPLSIVVPLIFITILFAFLFNYRLSLSITGFHLIPTWAHVPHYGAGRGNHYVEDIPRTQINSSQQNKTNIPFLDSDTPLFVMNWKGLKKLSSSTVLGDGSENSKKEAKEIKNEEDQSLGDEDEKMIENLREFETFVESMETQKCIEERKKRSIHTCTEGESTLTNRRSDSQSASTIENTDSSSGDRNETSISAGKKKDFKDKTS